MIVKLQELKSKTKLKSYQNISNYYAEMGYRSRSNTFQFDEDPFIKISERNYKLCHEVLFLMKFS